MGLGKKEAIALFGSLAVFGGCFGGLALMDEADTPSQSEAATTEQPDVDHWEAALEAGYSAAVAAQSAQTPEEWDAVAEGWGSAIGSLALVQDDHPNYAEKTAKSDEYKANREAARAKQKAAATAWLPDDGEYTVRDAEGVLGDTTPVGWRWLNGQEFSCEYGDYCFGMAVVPKYGCPDNLYIELSLLDDEDSNIGFTNASTSGVGSGQTAKLTFSGYEDYTDAVQSARLAKISCY